MKLNSIFHKNNKNKGILEAINQGRDVLIRGLSNSRLSFFTGNIFDQLSHSVFLITYDAYRIDQIYEDLIRLLPDTEILVYPELDMLPHEQINPDITVTRDRLKVLQELITDKKRKIILTTGTALMRKLMPLSVFEKHSIHFHVGEEIDFKELNKTLHLLGYKRVNMVEEPQQFSIRGGIVDVYPIIYEYPIRIELFGDEIDSIRTFDTASQRSLNDKQELIISPAREIILLPNEVKKRLPAIKKAFEQTVYKLIKTGSKEEAQYLKEKGKEAMENLAELIDFPGYEQFLPYFFPELNTLLDYLNSETLLFFDQVNKVWQRIESYFREIEETQTTLLEQGSILHSYLENFLIPEQFRGAVNNHNSLFFTDEFRDIPFGKDYREFAFHSSGVEPYHGKLELFKERLKELLKENYIVVITLNTDSKAKRIAEYLQDEGLPALYMEDEIKGKLTVIPKSLSEGFSIDELNLVVFTEKEVIGNPQRKKRQLSEMEDSVVISSLNELNVGDYVVHENHGIGKYLGVKTLEVQNQHQDYLLIKYAGEDKLYVPTEQVNLVQKYIGADNSTPKLYKLGGNEWKKVKQRVKDSVKEMAIGLLELYAERETVTGYAFSEDTVWQREFEEAFPYEETPDQIKAITDVKQDMEGPVPMDRLLCGDVGYGKTEVAIRAAFKSATEGKQTAVLVPTTILAQQHYNTFKARVKDFPINVEMISRFKTQKEQRETLKRVTSGEVDIIIGTHRLLSKDVVFKELGLLIIDEEQRFGVTHKERLKDMKRNVDVLTLTATPIPRTLHMALVGVRDMSVIETPPENRYPIRTYIREFNRELIREVIRREMGREGQVYFVHNRVENIEDKADMIKALIPEARVAVAHGQMNEHRLEKLMLAFYNQEYDVLVCTTIIETGLDIPNVNTIIINRADKLGLAQLYQLRGRVGRSNRIAYAYLLYERDRILPEVAEKRLKAIKEFTNLGSGFKIAMRDLEIRGAGNLLGPEQHGHIASIGFSLYTKLLEAEIEELKGKKKDEETEIEIDLKRDAYLPDEYLADSNQKIEIYKKIMGIRSEEDISDVIDELLDRFGDPPQVVMNLIEISKIKIKARSLGIDKIKQEKEIINCYFINSEQVDGKAIIRLIEQYPRKIKIRSAEKPVLGIKVSNKKDPLAFVRKVLNSLISISSIN